MNIIIVGCGNVGCTVAEQLVKDNHNIVVVDKEPGRANQLADELDVLGVEGNGLDYQVLLRAGIEHTDLLIATTDTDEQNLLCCVMAKHSDRYCHTIARVRDPIYNTEVAYLRQELELALIINPEFISASDMARRFQYPKDVRVETFTRGRVELSYLTVPEKSSLSGVSVAKVKSRFHCNVLICAIERGEELFLPSADTVIRAGDLLAITAAPLDARKFYKKTGLAKEPVKSAILVGGGAVGYYLAKRLLEGGIRTKIIEKDPKRCEMLSEELPKAIVIKGDGTDEKLLLREGLGGIGAFAALTEVDEENVLLTHFAMRVSHARTVTKLQRNNYSDIVHSIQLERTIFPSMLTAEYIAKYARTMTDSDSNFGNSFDILDGRANVLEIFIREESAVTNIPFSQLRTRDGIIVCAITRNDHIIIPGGRDEIRIGDNVFLFSLHPDINKIEDILANERNM